MADEIVKVYVTKYACSSDITRTECQISSGGFAYPTTSWGSYGPKDWFRTFEEAKADAERRREKKLASLRKQIAKLEARVWKEPA